MNLIRQPGSISFLTGLLLFNPTLTVPENILLGLGFECFPANSGTEVISLTQVYMLLNRSRAADLC